MFENLGWAEIVALVLVGLFIFGPDKLPKAISDGLRFVRNVRAMATNATADLSREMGTDIRLEDLNPKAFIRKHVLSDEEQSFFRGQAEELKRDLSEAVREPDPEAKPEVAATAAAPRKRTFDLDAT